MIDVLNVYNYYYTKLIWINHFKCSSNMPPTPKHNTTSFFSSSKWWTTKINGSGPWENEVLIAQQILERTYLLQGDHGSQICFPCHFSFEPPLISSLFIFMQRKKQDLNPFVYYFLRVYWIEIKLSCQQATTLDDDLLFKRMILFWNLGLWSKTMWCASELF